MTYLYNILLWLDEGANVLLFGLLRKLYTLPPASGNGHYTVSQTLAEMRERGSKIGCIGCKILTKVWSLWIKKPDYDHCTDAMDGMPEDIENG